MVIRPSHRPAICVLLPALAIVVPLLALAPLSRAQEASRSAIGSTNSVQTPATQPADAKPQFLRFVDNGATGSRLETAVARFRNKDGVTVDLVGAVHIAEKSYFEKLNTSFEKYDAVLYEMVKPKEIEAPEPGYKSDNPISQFQHLLKDTLGLEYQLDVIDYKKPNFVHADLDRETFEKLQAERGESIESLMLHQILNAITHPPEAPQARDTDQDIHDVIKVFTRPDMERQVKLLLARQFGDIENAAGNFGLGGTVILDERNKHAMKVTADTIAAGKKKIAVFYGAAHLPGMSKTLIEMGFKPVSTEWNMAWDLTIRADQPSAVEKLLDSVLKGLDDN
jgi:hypothetical protein